MHQEYPCDQFWRNTHRLLDKMTYLRSYLNDMLKKHPQGEGFKLIRKAARRAGNLHPREATELETVSLGILQLVSLFFPLFWTASFYNSNFRLPDDNASPTPPDEKKLRVFADLRIQVSEFIRSLDNSEESQWLAQYMVDEGASCCDVVKDMFKEYLANCQMSESDEGKK